MKKTNKAKTSAGPLSFVKGFKNKIVGTVFQGAPKDQASTQLEAAHREIKSLKARKESLQSKWQLMTRRSKDDASIEVELKKIREERKRLAEKTAHNEEEIKALYAKKDGCLKDAETLKANLKKVLAEKRAVQSDTTQVKEQEREVEKLKEELARTKKQEQEISSGFEEIEMRLKFATANMETLVLDSAAAQKAIDNLTRVVENKKESVDSAEKAKAKIGGVIAKLEQIQKAKESAIGPLQEFRTAIGQLKQTREAIKAAEEEQGAIPKKVAELNAAGGKDKEKADLLERAKFLAAEVERLRAQEKIIADGARKNKTVLEKVEQASLDVKHLMMSAGLNDFVSKVDSVPLHTLKADIERKQEGIINSLNHSAREISQAQADQAQKRSAITRMRDELNKLSKEAERDKADVERQREKLKKTKDQTATLRADLEAKLREKTAAISQAMNVTMELKRVEGLESDSVRATQKVQAEIEGIDRKIEELLTELRDDKIRLEELAELENFFADNLAEVQELKRLQSVERELALARDVAAKYEADCRRLNDVERQRALLETKLALVDEAEVPIPVLESRLAEMQKEQALLEKELDPLRSELDFAIEKRDNTEMDISFARESLRRAEERKKSLERKLEFVTQESGSIKGIQEKLASCEKKLSASEQNIAEIQTRLNFTTATEEVVKENFAKAQAAIERVDKQIESVQAKLEEKETQLPGLRAKAAEYEKSIDNEQGAKVEAELRAAELATRVKKNAIECDGLAERIKDLEASLKKNKEKESSIEEILPSYNANLEKQKQINGDIKDLHSEIDKLESKVDEIKTQLADIQDKKRDLMENALESSGTDQGSEEVSGNQGEIDSLKEERKATRGQIKDIEAKIKELKSEDTAETKDALRKERDGLRKKIDQINEQIDSLKEGGGAPAAGDTPAKGDAKKLAAAIGELDIKAMSLAKTSKNLESDLEQKIKNLEDLTHARDELSLEIENQKSTLSPLDEIKRKISSMETEKNSVQKSLEDKMGQKEEIARKIKDADEERDALLKTFEEAQRGLNEVRGDIGTIEASTAGLKEELDGAVRNRENTLNEFNRLKIEMDSIINNTRQDRDRIEREKETADDARKDVEETRKQLNEAMSILTGKTGSVDNLKLELASSVSEQKDAGERIKALEVDLKSATAVIKGIESNMDPKVIRMKYVAWAQGIINRNLEDLKLRTQLEEVSKELKELKDTRELYDKYNDLARSKEELRKRSGEIKSHLELETQILAAEQARHEAMAQASEYAEKVELQEALIRSLEEKFKDSEEDRVRLTGMLDDTTHRFEMARDRWGKIEDLSRVEDSLELKIREFRDKFGSMERVSEKLNRLEKENADFTQRVKGLEETCNALHKDKKSLETALEKTRNDFEAALRVVKESRDEAKKFLYS